MCICIGSWITIMIEFVGAMITVISVMIMAVLSWIVTPASLKTEYAGSYDTTEMNTGAKPAPTLQQIINAQASKMDPKLKTQFAELFTEAYADADAPPIVTLDDIKHSMPYADVSVFRTATHIGQRKLFLTELQFLVDAVPAGQQCVCVYAGAAPSNHTGYLAALFPHVKFLLVDPNPFEVREAKPIMLAARGGPPIDQATADKLVAEALAGSERIYIINDLMTMEIARACRQIPHDQLYFVSDIRTNATDGAKEPDTVDILWNLSQQYNWMSCMRPRWSMLKFRHPFYAEPVEVFERKHSQAPYAADFAMSKEYGIDFVENHKTQTLVYWAGTVNLQAFPGQSSTETRLITEAKETHNWGPPADYENRLFYYNSVERCFRHHINDNADRALGFDHCNDCALENHLWKKYIAYSGDTVPVRARVKKLSDITFRPLVRENHGHFFDKYDPASLLRAIQDFQRAPKQPVYMFGQPKKDHGRGGDRGPRPNQSGRGDRGGRGGNRGMGGGDRGAFRPGGRR